jgi:hypothetical protein
MVRPFNKIKISPIQRFGDMSDGIPDHANAAIANRNQTNLEVARGLDCLQRILMQAEGI